MQGERLPPWPSTPKDGGGGGQAVVVVFIPKPWSWGGWEVCSRAAPQYPCWTGSKAARATISQCRGQSRDTLHYLGPTAQSPSPTDGASSCREPAGLGHHCPSLPASANSQAGVTDVPMGL